MAKVVKHISDLALGLGLGASDTQVKEIQNKIDDRSVSRFLTTLRVKSGLTQKEAAAKLEVSQSFISKIEHSTNNEISNENLGKYLKAFDYQLTLDISPTRTLSQKILATYKELTSLVNELQNSRRDDTSILLGIAKFETHLAQELMDVVGGLLDKSKSKISQIQESENVLVNISEPKVAVLGNTKASKKGKARAT